MLTDDQAPGPNQSPNNVIRLEDHRKPSDSNPGARRRLSLLELVKPSLDTEIEIDKGLPETPEAEPPSFTYPLPLMGLVDNLIVSGNDDMAYRLLGFCDQIGEQKTTDLTDILVSIQPDMGFSLEDTDQQPRLF